MSKGMGYYIVYCDGGTPKLKRFGSEIKMNEWLIDFLMTKADGSSWIDYIFHGELLRSNSDLNKGE